MALSRKKKIIIAVSAVALLSIIVVISVLATRKEEAEVTTVKIDVRPELRQTVTASGEVRPIRYIKLTSEVQGRIEEIFVNAGDQVTQGKPLVRIDPSQLQSSQEAQWAAAQQAINDIQSARNAVSAAEQGLVVAEASVASARQQEVALRTALERAQVDLNTAQRELKRNTDLIEAGVTSRFEYDAARDKYEQAKLAVDTAKANLESQRIAVKEAIERANQQKITVRDARTGIKSSEMRASQQQALLRGQADQRSKATQLSPLTGVIADIPARVGEFAVAGLSTTPLMTIADMSTINVEVNVDETEISNVEVGQNAKVKVDALGDKEVTAVVTQKNPLAVSKSDTQGGLSNRVNVQEAKEFKVTVELREMSDEIRNALRPGMSATATITTKVKNNVIAVPLEAIVEKSPSASPSPSASVASAAPAASPGEKPKNQKGVYVLEGNKVRFIEVTTGITGEADIEVTSGVQQGMEIVRGPSRVLKTLKDSMTVKRQERRPGANANSNEGS